jgi:hypothetical protein
MRNAPGGPWQAKETNIVRLGNCFKRAALIVPLADKPPVALEL